jgi:hypothetical protein
MTGLCTAGACLALPQPCKGYLCTGGPSCPMSCNADTDCAPNFYCTGKGGSCLPVQANGTNCGAGHQCATGFCVDGFCCNNACVGGCLSCALTNIAGTCTPVGAGAADPRGLCTDQGAASCGRNGKCDGLGACQLYAKNTVCVAASCPPGASTLTSARLCDGAGTCGPASQSDCQGFLCDGDQQCLTSCLDDTACAPPNVCDLLSMTCGSPPDAGM